ncbi:MAG: hypothetical protein F6J93_14300 [Oscillatoria sp. SIO1A7]|nr:hypothetical protein [Oscillatoria sp. SIO1A7]
MNDNVDNVGATASPRLSLSFERGFRYWDASPQTSHQFENRYIALPIKVRTIRCSPKLETAIFVLLAQPAHSA